MTKWSGKRIYKICITFWLNCIEFRQDVKTSELTMLPQRPNKMHKSTIKSLITTYRAWYIFAHSRLQKAKSRTNHSIDERKPVRTLLMKAQRFEKQLVWSLDLYKTLISCHPSAWHQERALILQWFDCLGSLSLIHTLEWPVAFHWFAAINQEDKPLVLHHYAVS